MEIILFVCSVIACLIGVFTFVVGMNGRSREDGVLVQKINQTIQGIGELKTDVKELSSSERTLAITVQSHEEKIATLFKMVNKSDAINEALITILTLLKQREERGEKD